MSIRRNDERYVSDAEKKETACQRLGLRGAKPEENEEKVVTAVYRPINSKTITIKHEGPGYVDDVTCTPDHPIYNHISGSVAGCCSFDIAKTKEDYGFEDLSELQRGTQFWTVTHQTSEVYEIVENEDKEQETYLISVADNDNYYVNGILVHNKKF